MIVTAQFIALLIENGVIENATRDLINATSMDVTLGSEVLIERVSGGYDWAFPKLLRSVMPKSVDLSKHESLDTIRLTIPDEGLVLPPGEFILACTEQVFNLPLTMSAEYKLKSSMARVGLENLHAGWCDPGWRGSKLTLELVNVTRHHNIILHRGDRIGQMVFFDHEAVSEEFSYAKRGRYNGDASVSGAKVPTQLTLSGCGVYVA